MIVENGEVIQQKLPENVMKRMSSYGITDPFVYEENAFGGVCLGRKTAVG
jgi:hypothetical protein